MASTGFQPITSAMPVHHKWVIKPLILEQVILLGSCVCRCDKSHEFKLVWIRATYRSDNISEGSVVASGVHFRQQVAATKYKWTNKRAAYGQPYWIRKLVHIPPHTRSLRMHRTGVVSQRLVLQVPYYMKFWRHVNLAILKNPDLATP